MIYLRGMSMDIAASTWQAQPVIRRGWQRGWESSRRAWTRGRGVFHASACAPASSSPDQTICPIRCCPSRLTEKKINTFMALVLWYIFITWAWGGIRNTYIFESLGHKSSVDVQVCNKHCSHVYWKYLLGVYCGTVQLCGPKQLVPIENSCI